MDDTTKLILSDLDDRIEKSIHHLTEQLQTIRTGRASPALVETIRVDYYGTPTPIQQLAHISVPEPRQLMLKPFDQSVIKVITYLEQQGLIPAAPGNDIAPDEEERIMDKLKALNFVD